MTKSNNNIKQYDKPKKAKRILLEVFDKTKHKGLHYSAIKNIEQSVYGNIDPLKVKARKLSQQAKAQQKLKLQQAKAQQELKLQQIKVTTAVVFLMYFSFSIVVFCVLFFGLLSLLGYAKLTLFSVILFILFSAFITNLIYKISRDFFTKKQKELEA